MHLEVIQKRKEEKSRALEARKSYNRTIREQDIGLPTVRQLSRPNCSTFAEDIQLQHP